MSSSKTSIQSRYSYWMIVPAGLLFLLFFLIPSVIGIGFSFTDWNVNRMTEIHFNGLENFRLLLGNVGFNKALTNTLLFTFVTSILKATLGLALALIMNTSIKSKNYLRTIFFMPVILSTIVIGLIFTAILQVDGPLNSFLHLIGLGAFAKNWLGDPVFAIWACIGVEVWKYSGFCMVIFLAGLQTIPKEFYEASSIDGASGFQTLKKITIPLIMPSITINIVMNIIGGLKIFELVYILTNGGPGFSSQVLNGVVFNKFAGGTWGLGSAANLIMTIFVGVISLSTMKFLKKREVEM